MGVLPSVESFCLFGYFNIFSESRKGTKHTEFIHVLSLFAGCVMAGTLLVAEIMTADFYIKIRCERIS